METIIATAFGRVINIQTGEGDELTKAAAGVFAGSRGRGRLSFASVAIIISEYAWWQSSPWLHTVSSRFMCDA